MTAVAPTESLAQLAKALGDPIRVEVLRVLACNSYGVLELADIFEMTQPRMSHHLKVLANTELVSTRREGSAIFYRRAAPAGLTFEGLRHSAYHAVDKCPLSTGALKGVERVHAARAAVSARFFVDNASKFQAQQDLIASYPVYGSAMAELLNSTALPDTQHALEIGPGAGEFLSELSARFTTVNGLDNSASMLAQAQAKVTQNKLANVTLVHGDTTSLINPAQCSVAVMNMVLHHTPSPQKVLEDLYPALRPGGALLVTELCSHDQNWTKEACGDVWLGFEPQELDQWASTLGYTLGQSQYLALRNGFQIQLKQFFKPE